MKKEDLLQNTFFHSAFPMKTLTTRVPLHLFLQNFQFVEELWDLFGTDTWNEMTTMELGVMYQAESWPIVLG